MTQMIYACTCPECVGSGQEFYRQFSRRARLLLGKCYQVSVAISAEERC